MAVSYGTNTTYLEEHTGTQVPVYARGPGAQSVRGLIRQADLFDIVRRALALDEPVATDASRRSDDRWR